MPTALAGTVTTAAGLMVLRFFVGILGGTFVPCQVWAAGFFDASVIGTAAGLSAGIGNAGGGITYFVMPALFDVLVKGGLTEGQSWRVAFIVPFVLITATALGMLALCEDTPTGPWKTRHLHASPGVSTSKPSSSGGSSLEPQIIACVGGSSTLPPPAQQHPHILPPTLRSTLALTFTPTTLLLSLPYLLSFGGELAFNSILGAYISSNLSLAQSPSGRLAAVFGLANVLFRPLGGLLSDALFSSYGLTARKHLLIALTLAMGIVCVTLGAVDPKDVGTMMGLVLALALFMDAANGACFALVPAVGGRSVGILAGVVGAAGNAGGVAGAVVYRVSGPGWARGTWVMGAAMVLGAVAVSGIGVQKRSAKTEHEDEEGAQGPVMI